MMWNVIKNLLQEPLEKLCLIVGSVFIFLSFYSFSRTDGKLQFGPSMHVNTCFLSIGILLLVIFIFCLILKLKPKPPTLSSVEEIPNGYRIRMSPILTIDVITGKIENIEGVGTHGAIARPSNTLFDDECIQDSRSALGAFFQKHFPTGIDKIQTLITKRVSELPSDSRNTSAELLPGTTVFLDKPLGSQYRVLVTAVTRFSPEAGIRADTLSLIASIKAVFKISAIHRLSELYMPVLGTGHGGLGFSAALSLMLVQIVHSITHEGGHNIKRVVIVVYDPDNSRHEDVKKVIDAIGQIFGG